MISDNLLCNGGLEAKAEQIFGESQKKSICSVQSTPTRSSNRQWHSLPAQIVKKSPISTEYNLILVELSTIDD